MSANGLADLGAVELGALFRARTVSPVEATLAVLDRIAERDAEVNAFAVLDEAGALASARSMGSGQVNIEPDNLSALPRMALCLRFSNPY